jgi:hypothetical protein
MLKTMTALSLVWLTLGVAAAASAQDVVMNSAETINKGNIKLALFPTVLLGEDGAESRNGLAGRAGIGLAHRLDVEAKAAVFDGLKFYGADAELWLIRDAPLDVSVALGLHHTDLEVGRDSSGFDVVFLASTPVARRLELFGGVRVARDSLDDVDRQVTVAHAVPGIEYRVARDVDLLAEVGIGINEDSGNYASVGVAIYIR